MQVIDFIIPSELEQKVREELTKIAYHDENERRRKLALGMIGIRFSSSDPKEIAEAIIRFKDMVQVIFNDTN